MVDDPLNLDEIGEWAGLWWLPDDPDDQVPGVLRYDAEGGIFLALIGAFAGRIAPNPAPGVTAYHEGTWTGDVIHGVVEKREVTLLGCVSGGGRRSRSERVKIAGKQTVTATAAVIGEHISGEDDAAFSSAEISVEDLGLWAASSVFGDIPGADGRISVQPVRTQSVLVGTTWYRLEHAHTRPFFDQRKGATVGGIRDTVSVRVIPGAPFTLSVALREARLVQDLISLATHRAAGMLWLRLEVAGSPGRTADVLYTPAAHGRHDASAVDRHCVFFSCDSLPFDEVMPRWCEAHGRLQAATNMILGLRYAPARFIESNLLTAVGAAEVLHRGLQMDERPFPPTEFTALREAMLAQVPEEHRDRFKGAIHNDPTLRDRLLALAERPDREAIAWIVPDIAHWATQTTRARNDLAHEGRTADQSVDELFAVVEVTTAVVILNVLHELGLSPERQREIVREHPELRATARIAREWLVDPEL